MEHESPNKVKTHSCIIRSGQVSNTDILSYIFISFQCSKKTTV